MKRIIIIAAALVLSALCSPSYAQVQPSGTVVYSLPRTTVSVTVEATVVKTVPGPYARFAQKYFGVSAPQNPVASCTVNSITITPFIEADPEARYCVVIPEKGSSVTSYMSLTSQGLIATEPSAGNSASLRFAPQVLSDHFIGAQPSNLASVTTTLYKTVKNEAGEYEKVPVQQSQTVEKSLEKKAEEAAGIIFSLREKRIQIVTGDTDATFSGEAMTSALNEIDRLEKQYTELFFGAKTVFTQVKTFDVVPGTNAKQSHTVCRISGEGLSPASTGEGRAISMEISAQQLSIPEVAQGRGRENVTIYYRVPATATCRILDGGKMLSETRIIVYQLGEKVAMPL